MKKLYEVNIKVMVMAEDPHEALTIAKYNASIDIDDTEIYETESCDHAWWDVIPFGSDDDKTCGQIITDLQK